MFKPKHYKGLKPVALEEGMEYPFDLMIVMEIVGNQTEVIADWIFLLRDRGTGRLPYGTDLFYHFKAEFSSTTLILRGNYWQAPIAEFISRYGSKLEIKAWSNWDVPCITKYQRGYEIMHDEELDSRQAPAIGYLEDIIEYLDNVHEVAEPVSIVDTEDDEMASMEPDLEALVEVEDFPG